MTTLAPIHPGEVLIEDFIEPLGVTQHSVAIAVGVPPRRINEIVHGKRRITADTALRLARYFGTTDRFWLNLQARTTWKSSAMAGAGTGGDHTAAVGLTLPGRGTWSSSGSLCDRLLPELRICTCRRRLHRI